jgi:hypothetical protein
MTLLVRAPETYPRERRYVLDVILSEWLGLDYALDFDEVPHVAIRLAGDPQESEISLPDAFFATPSWGWLAESSLPIRPLARLKPSALSPSQAAGPNDPAAGSPGASRLPVVFGSSAADGLAWRRTAKGASLSVDVFGSVFFLLTRYEEIVRRNRDVHDRFPASASLAAVEGFLDRAIVDEYVDLLWMAMHSLWPALVRRSATFRLRLTHDVDLPWAALAHRALGGDLVRRRDASLAARRVRSFIDARGGRVDRDPFNTFDFLMDTSERHGLRSTFYFRTRGMYRLSDPPVADLLRRIHEQGHEVGLHAGYESYRSPERTSAEFEELRAACRGVGFDQPQWGVRQHYLRLDNPQTWRNHESAGLDHDSTLGFADQVGFRAGTCREYPLFDLLDRRTLKLRERPLLVMDATMFGYMRLGLDEASSLTRTIAGVCRRHKGDAVVLYHNDSLWSTRHRAHYRELVEEIAHAG